ncbi:MAG: hypothetical protein ABFD44_12145 [Anaerolineaceae bacterium]
MTFLISLFPWLRRIRFPFSRDQLMLLLAAMNLIVLGVDIYFAHLLDGVLKPLEWIPILFGPISGVMLLAAGLIARRNRILANLIATIIFFACMIVAVLGTIFHLNRSILLDAVTMQVLPTSILLWAPPILGPLTFALVALIGISAAWEEDPPGSGNLRLLGNKRIRMPYSKTRAYFLLASLFLLATVLMSVLDHARTNFVNPWLWAPTLVGVFAVTVSAAMGFFSRTHRSDLLTFFAAMLLMIITGLVGFVLHIDRNLIREGTIVGERFLRGAPMMAPLLFANMGLLGIFILFDPTPYSPPTEE